MYIVPKRRSRIRPNCQPVSGPSGSIDYTDKQLFNTAETLYTAMLTFAQESASKNASSTTQMRPSCYGLDRTINLFQQGRVGLVPQKKPQFQTSSKRSSCPCDLSLRFDCNSTRRDRSTEYRWTPLRVQNLIEVQMHPWRLVETTRVTELEYYFACTRKVVHLYSVTSPCKMIFAVLELWMSPLYTEF